MNIHTYIPSIISCILIIIQLVILPSRKKKIIRQGGTCILPLKRRKSFVLPAATVFCIILNILVALRSFEYLYQVILCATSALAYYIACREYITSLLGGIYQSGIFITGSFIPFNSITAFPAAQWDDYESYLSDKTSFELQTTRGSTTLTFFSIDECKKAADCLLEQIPRLKCE
ncbi:MAG: hypothetical protein K6E51_03355 [Treponema sp.]|nr:hypothetical protein [Treponema sp.]